MHYSESFFFVLIAYFFLPADVVVNNMAIGAVGLVSILRPIKSDTVSSTAAGTFLRSGVALAISHGDGPRHSLHASV